MQPDLERHAVHDGPGFAGRSLGLDDAAIDSIVDVFVQRPEVLPVVALQPD